MVTNKNVQNMIRDMEFKLEMILKWLKDSGLVVNEEKTEICLFYKRDHPNIEITINNKVIKSKSQIMINKQGWLNW